MRIITLTTDFGLGDGYAGVLKGVIWKIAPQVQIADISHGISPQNVLEGALTLGRAAVYFPEGTIHVGVVDPGVGTARRAIAARLGAQYFVGPDNGLFTVLLEQAERKHEDIAVIHLDQPQFWLPSISHVFHGRDIFAPSAAHLALGVPLESLGTPIQDPQRLELPVPKRLAGSWQGQILSIDHFGNLSTNLDKDLLDSLKNVKIHYKKWTIDGLVGAFGDGEPGQFVALIDSSNHLSLNVVNGNAAEQFNARIGDKVEIYG
ncbi:MAG TPA: SAM-dependent chlorinase/fluorinase [Anaerolineaceae bacterium]|nr:SAM-dependent chlorinase/fluorinase [Anaerolineaceae bacterium]